MSRVFFLFFFIFYSAVLEQESVKVAEWRTAVADPCYYTVSDPDTVCEQKGLVSFGLKEQNTVCKSLCNSVINIDFKRLKLPDFDQ